MDDLGFSVDVYALLKERISIPFSLIFLSTALFIKTTWFVGDDDTRVSVSGGEPEMYLLFLYKKKLFSSLHHRRVLKGNGGLDALTLYLSSFLLLISPPFFIALNHTGTCGKIPGIFFV